MTTTGESPLSASEVKQVRDEDRGEVTVLLQSWSSGDVDARDRLFELVYSDLHRLAASRLYGERSELSIEATDLAHEVFLRLVEQRRTDWQCRAQFFALTSTLLRRILVDRAKRRGRLKRGGGAMHVSFEAMAVGSPAIDIDLLALDEALVELAAIRLTAARIVELRFIAGLSVEETAQVIGLSRRSVMRRWRFARAWLLKRLGGIHG